MWTRFPRRWNNIKFLIKVLQIRWWDFYTYVLVRSTPVPSNNSLKCFWIFYQSEHESTKSIHMQFKTRCQGGHLISDASRSRCPRWSSARGDAVMPIAVTRPPSSRRLLGQQPVVAPDAYRNHGPMVPRSPTRVAVNAHRSNFADFIFSPRACLCEYWHLDCCVFALEW